MADVGTGAGAGGPGEGLVEAGPGTTELPSGLLVPDALALPGPPPARGRRPPAASLAVGAVLGLQLLALLAYSTWLFHRFDLTDDFGTYTQAWWLIGHGHLNPVDTIQSPLYPFVESHAELAMWPLGWLGRLWPDPLVLLWLQDVALVATELVVVVWIRRIVAGRRTVLSPSLTSPSLTSPSLTSPSSAVALVAVVAVASNALWYETASFDVHAETLGLPLLVLSAYGLWHRRPRLAWTAALLALCFGDVVAVALLCVCVAGLVSPDVRRSGGTATAAGLLVASSGWLVAVVLLGADRGSGLVTNYGYLVHAGPHASGVGVVLDLLAHPVHVVHVAALRWRGLGRVLTASGTLGVLSPLGLAVALGVLVPASVNVDPAFLSSTIAFQTLAVVPFVLVGTAAVLVRVAGGPGGGEPGASARRSPAWRLPAAWALAAAVLAVSVLQSAAVYPRLRSEWWRVGASTAAVLGTALARTPPGAEVVASQGVIGRFAGRQWVFPYLAAPQAFPVRAGTVEFVIVPDQGIEPVPPALAESAVAYLRRDLHASTVLDERGVTVLVWHPPPGTTSVVLP